MEGNILLSLWNLFDRIIGFVWGLLSSGIALGLVILFLVLFLIHYRKSTYYKETQKNYLSVRMDLGTYGEYLTYRKLQGFEKKGGRFLFNTYINKDTDETTEIDVILICQNGLFVFESKNYSGWIFGNEKQLMWTQTLPKGKGKSNKEHFYNPVLQNKTHIRELSKLIEKDIPVFSVIVFSERCTLKNVTVNDDVRVIKRESLLSTVTEICNNNPAVLSAQKIDEIFNTLHPYTNASDDVKKRHIENIKTNYIKPKAEVSRDPPKANDKLPTINDVLPTANDDSSATNDALPMTVDNSSTTSNESTITTDATDTTDTTDESPKTYNTASENEVKHICPKCGSELVLRTANKGKNAGKCFWGCSGFPKCKYTQDID